MRAPAGPVTRVGDCGEVGCEPVQHYLAVAGLSERGASHFSSARSGRVASRSMMLPKACSALRARRVATRIWARMP